MRWMFHLMVSVGILANSFGPAISRAAAVPPDANGIEFFEKKIRPVLIEQCYKCHSANAQKVKGGLTLDTRAGLLEGGESGPAIVPGQPAKSLLIKSLRHDGLKMPNESTKLPATVIADFETWVKMGAPDPRDGKISFKKGIDYVQARKHWAYQPLKNPGLPPVHRSDWSRSDLDRHVLAKIETASLKPTEDAPAHALIRRMSFALTGLPPTPDEVTSFEKAYAANPDQAVEAAADRLLASPRFGEYWARHWLDGIRYDPTHPSVAYYRNWLIQAFNTDMPYDRFIVWQLAGDLLPSTGDARADDDKIIATQMLTLNLHEMDLIEGMVEVTGQQFLGQSIHCAKCHDHKFDAYTQQDYYALAGIFHSTGIAGFVKTEFTPEPLKTYGGAKVLSLRDSVKRRGDMRLLIRGEKRNTGPVVPRRFPLLLAGDNPTPISQITKGSGRLELAQWIADANNPLTARVMANRIWMWTTGVPLVLTPNDFGTVGTPPTHPAVLDELASRFVRSKWSIKSVIREIVKSRTFRQSSHPSAAIRTADPQNQLLSRMPLRRLDAEQLADSLYFISGTLNLNSPPLDPKSTASRAPVKKVKSLNRESSPGDFQSYRAVYGFTLLPEVMFDAADPDLLVDRRDESVTAPQMLFFLNHPLMPELAKRLAHRAESAGSGDSRIQAAARIALSRTLSTTELVAAQAFVQKHGLDRYCHLLLCTNEFMYVE